MFDCVMPTRNARNGMLFTKNGIINIRNEKWKRDFTPIDEFSDLNTNQTYSKAYLSHLVRNNEILAAQISTLNNLHFYLWLVKEARKHILNGTFISWKNEMVIKLMTKL